MEHTYYGRHDNKKPTHGVHFMLFEEHIKKIHERQLKQFEKATDDILCAMRKEMQQNAKEIKYIKDKFSWIAKEFDKDSIKKISTQTKIFIEAAEIRNKFENKKDG